MIKKILPLLFIATLLSACSSPPSQFYVLSPLTHQGRFAKKVKTNLSIGPVNVAEYLQQPAIVTRLKTHELLLNEFHRWAQPLQSNVEQVLLNNLQLLLPRANVMSYSSVVGQEAHYRVAIQVTQFATDMTGHSDLTASWQIIHEKNNKVIKQYRKTLRRIVNPHSFNSIVKGMNANLNQLSRIIAKTIS